MTIPLQNPDGTIVPLDPSNPRRGAYNITIPVEQIIFPGGDTSFVTNLEYRVPDRRPGHAGRLRRYRLGLHLAAIAAARSPPSRSDALNSTIFGCPYLNSRLHLRGRCTFRSASNLKPISGTNYQPRMSTGLELQVIMPVVNAPFRFYYAYNPLRLDETVHSPNPDYPLMFPAGAAGDYTYAQAISLYQPSTCARAA